MLAEILSPYVTIVGLAALGNDTYSFELVTSPQKLTLIDTSGMAQFHQLDKHCRVCGGRLQKPKGRAPMHECTLHMAELESTSEVDVATDGNDVHPQFFCNCGYAAVKRHSTAASKGIPYSHSIEVSTWEKHHEKECAVCTIYIVKPS